MFSDYYELVGTYEILDIGLVEDFIEAQTSKYQYLILQDIIQLYRPRNKFSHKGSFGHGILLAGSKGKMGAAILSAKACLRSGAGLLTVNIPACGYIPMQTALPEAMVICDEQDEYLRKYPDLSPYSAIAMGPGMGQEKETAQVLKVIIQQAAVPLVLDADALNILAENKTWISFLPANTILCPHPKEFDRLTYAHTSAYDRLQTARSFALKYQVIVILKGAHTAIVLPDQRVFFNSSGNAALAKGGSGDVLTGMLLAYLANGYKPFEAALMGVFLHGMAADRYVDKFSIDSMLSGDLIDMLKEVNLAKFAS